MLYTSTGNEKIHRAALDSFLPTKGLKTRSLNIGRTAKSQQGEWLYTTNQLLELFGRTKSIQKFLENIPKDKEAVFSSKMMAEGLNERIVFLNVGPPQDE